MAFHDWPEFWPNFIESRMAIADGDASTERVRVFQILAKFLEQLHSSL
jgi:hypothetical protein